MAHTKFSTAGRKRLLHAVNGSARSNMPRNHKFGSTPLSADYDDWDVEPDVAKHSKNMPSQADATKPVGDKKIHSRSGSVHRGPYGEMPAGSPDWWAGKRNDDVD